MAVLTMTEDDVLKVLPKVDVFSTVESMFGALGRGEALQPRQVQTLFPGDKGDFINYTGVWMSAGVYGVKTSPFIIQEKGYTVTAWTLLMSTETGKPLLSPILKICLTSYEVACSPRTSATLSAKQPPRPSRSIP